MLGGLLTADAVTSQRPQKWQDRGVSEWVFFMHPPRDDFIATMSGAERAAFDAHAAWLRRLLADGLLIAAGPCLGQVNTGIAIFEAASEERSAADCRRRTGDQRRVYARRPAPIPAGHAARP